jgi:hypothetical protein
LYGTDLRRELPILNLRLRKNYLQNKNINIFSIGLSLNHVTYPVTNIGCSIKTFKNLMKVNFILILLYTFMIILLQIIIIFMI